METLKTVRKLEKTLKKLARYKNHLTFAIRCKSSHIQPKGLRLKCGLKSPKTKRIVETAERKLLHEHIHGIVRTIENLKNEIIYYEERLGEELSEEIFQNLKKRMDDREHAEYERVKARQKGKFSRLAGFSTNHIREDDGHADQGASPTEDVPDATASGQTERTRDSVATEEGPFLRTTPADTTAGQGDGAHDDPPRLEGRPPSASHLSLPDPAIEPTTQSADAGQPTLTGTGDCDRLQEKWVVNLSGRALSDAEVSVLNKGLNFVPTPKHVNDVEFITEVEKLVAGSNMTQDEANRVRFEVTKALQSFKPGKDNLTAEERRALRSLREKEDLMILPSDKGKSVCVLSKEQYKSKVQDLITDEETYEELQSDPTPSYVQSVTKVSQMVTGRLACRPIQFERHWPGDPTTGQRGGAEGGGEPLTSPHSRWRCRVGPVT